jgi:hypothetical protein
LTRRTFPKGHLPKEAAMWARWLNIALSIWLVLAPFLLGYEAAAARANSVTVGMCIFVVALVADAVPAFRFGNTALGLWLIAAPFLLRYGGELPPTASDIVVGVLVTGLSLVSPGRLHLGMRRARA